MSEQQRTCLHEAGHCAMARAWHWTPGPVTVVAGSAAAGCTGYQPVPFPLDVVATLNPSMPFMLWPEPIRTRLESDVLVLMAGNISELMLVPVTEGRQADSAADSAALLLRELPPLGDQDRAGR